ncbi:hypothetical protein H0H92_010054 [Tricholoma furcatifolium]|nr:hypothetical protein H0H92_010054 [Tricholoma furcatifolium]
MFYALQALAVQTLVKPGILGRVFKSYLPHPFAVITVAGDESLQYLTDPVEATINPHWQNLYFALTVDRSSIVLIQFYDRRKFRKIGDQHGLLGDAKVNGNAILNYTIVNRSATLEIIMNQPKEAKLTMKLLCPSAATDPDTYTDTDIDTDTDTDTDLDAV